MDESIAVVTHSRVDHGTNRAVIKRDVGRGIEEREVGGIEQGCLVRGACLAENATTLAAMMSPLEQGELSGAGPDIALVGHVIRLPQRLG